MENYYEIILNDKIFIQRTPYSKFTEFTLDGTKENTYDELPQEVKKIIEKNEEISRNPNEYFEYHIENSEVIIDKILKSPDSFLKIPSHIEGYPVVELASRFASYDHVNLDQMQLPHTLKKLNEYTFQSVNIGYINLPQSITDIPRKCFFDSLIKSIDLSYVKYIGENAFNDCNNLKKVDMSNVERIETGAFAHCRQLVSAILPKNLTIVPSYLFYDCNNFNNINIPPSVESIEPFAFANTAIEKINLPESLKIVNKYAFSKCKKLSELITPINLVSIEKNAFEECKNLRNVVLNKGLEQIKSEAFRDTPIKMLQIPRNTKYCSDSFSDFTIKIKDVTKEDPER